MAGESTTHVERSSPFDTRLSILSDGALGPRNDSYFIAGGDGSQPSVTNLLDVRLTCIATISGRTTTGEFFRCIISVAPLLTGFAWPGDPFAARPSPDMDRLTRGAVGELRTDWWLVDECWANDDTVGEQTIGLGETWNPDDIILSAGGGFLRRSIASISFFWWPGCNQQIEACVSIYICPMNWIFIRSQRRLLWCTWNMPCNDYVSMYIHSSKKLFKT